MGLRGEGDTPSTLIDFFGRDFLLIIDESHVTVPQIHGMYKGDRSRKESLVNYGWRLPSAMDNRPLKYDEFYEKIDKVIYMSATPGNYELDRKLPITEQIIRPTYLLDPVLEVRYEIKDDKNWVKPEMKDHPEILIGYKERMIDNLWNEIKQRVANKERVLITTLTIKMSEELTDYFKKAGLKVAYLHSKVTSLDRMKILQELRLGIHDCLIGINLLREGLDLPEVSLVVILDADKQGFLRSKTSLIQTIGRAARNLNGKVIMYADAVSESMEFAINETFRRRKIQEQFNIDNNVVPVSIKKDIQDLISNLSTSGAEDSKINKKDALSKQISAYEKEMKKAATELDFEKAAQIRDILFELKKNQPVKK
jgi:excinuclease ABC subunit B